MIRPEFAVVKGRRSRLQVPAKGVPLQPPGASLTSSFWSGAVGFGDALFVSGQWLDAPNATTAGRGYVFLGRRKMSGVPDFTISVSPASLNVTRGNTGSYTVTIGAVNSFTGTVSLSVSGLGSRVTGTFSLASVTGSGTSTLTVQAARNATRGARTITITGVSGSLNHSTTATLTVQ